jgi:hypothetical protein
MASTAVLCHNMFYYFHCDFNYNNFLRRKKFYSQTNPMKNRNKKSERTGECQILKIHPETKIFDKNKIKKIFII